MNKFEKDIKLKQFLKFYTPESPGPDFSGRVMKSIFEEQSSLEQVRKYPVLRRSFWVFLLLFTTLIVFAVISRSNTDQSVITNFLTDEILTGYRSFITQIGTLPLSMASILTATSLLVFLGNLLDKRLDDSNTRI